MNYSNFFKGSKDFEDLYRSIKYKKQFRKEHPEYFDPDGILVFCGPQGSGKTLSAVQYVLKLLAKYPDCILCTNINITSPIIENRQVYPYTGITDLSKYSNGYGGVIFLIDEIQIEFNSLESKDIDPVVITEIAQQRKQRKHIVGTSQVFNRIAKPFREQFKYACICKNFFGLVQYNCLVRGEDCTIDDTGKMTTSHVQRFLWFHRAELYDSYNTFAKIIRTNKEGFKHGRRGY